MRTSTKRLLALLLVAVMALSTVACAAGTETGETQAGDDTGAVTEGETTYKPDIDVKNYDCDFNFVASGSSVPREVIAIEDMEDMEAGDLETAVYERGLKLKDHLGVTLVYQDAGDWIAYAANVSKTVQAGDDAYQMVLTHVYQGVTDLIHPTPSTTSVCWNPSTWRLPTGPPSSWRRSRSTTDTSLVTTISAWQTSRYWSSTRI